MKTEALRGRHLTPRKAPTQERARETVSIILEAAALEIQTRGYGQLTASRVAERAGVGVGTLYQYFPNVESIASALVDYLVKQELDSALHALENALHFPIQAVIEKVVETLIDLHSKNEQLRQGLFLQGHDQGKTQAWIEAERAIETHVLDLLKIHPDTQKIDDLEMKSLMVIHLAERTIDLAAERGELGERAATWKRVLTSALFRILA